MEKKIRNVAVVSLSRGVLGEPFLRHELDIGIRRLEGYGLTVTFMPHALMGLDHIRDHPEDRAADLLAAFRDPAVDMILCAIGGDDTYRLLPCLFGRDELKQALTDKIFLGFSDTTIDHFMLHKLGLPTFYGQAFLPDICELDREMLPYTKAYFEELIRTGMIAEIRPSSIWYEERKDFGPDQIGVPHPSHPDCGFELLQGPETFSGKILGGCIDSIFDIFHDDRYADMPALCRQYGLFPPAEEWRGRILLLETSEEQMAPAKYRLALETLKDPGVFGAVSGILIGKPMDKVHDEDYRQILKDVIADPALPVVCNLNIGHALPRCIIPFGVDAVVDTKEQVIRFADRRSRSL